MQPTTIRKQWDVATLDFTKKPTNKFGIDDRSIPGAIQLLKDWNLRPKGSSDSELSFKDLQALAYLLTEHKYDTSDFTSAIIKAIAELKVEPALDQQRAILASIASIVRSVLDFKMRVSTVAWAYNNKQVMVAGTGRRNISQKLVLVTEAIARMLANKGYGIVTGGWAGVDHVLSRAYSEALKLHGISEKAYLTQVVIQNKKSDHAYGTILQVNDDTAWYDHALVTCCAVILLGGEGGTAEAYEKAKEKNIPVIPLPATSGDAKMVYDKLINQKDYLISRPQLQALEGPVTSMEDADVMALHVKDILQHINIEF